MKVYVLLGLNGEYHGYDIFHGVFKTFEDAINYRAQRHSWLGDKLEYVCHRHKDSDEDDDEFNKTHTHVVFFNKKICTITESDLIVALKNNDEEFFDDFGYDTIESVVIEEVEL